MKRDHEEKIEKYIATVFRCAYSFVKNRHDAEDIMQEVFVKYLTKKPFFADENHEKAWFIRVTINMSKNYLRSFWFRNREEFSDDLVGDNDNESSAELWSAIYELPEKYRVTIVMYYIENYSIKEISQILKKKQSTVGTWLERGKKKLKQIMEEKYHG